MRYYRPARFALFFVLALPLPLPVMAGQSGPVPPTRLEMGRMIYEVTYGNISCGRCHGVEGEGEQGPDIRGRSPADIKAAIAEVDVMKFMSNLSDEELQILGEYLQSIGN